MHGSNYSAGMAISRVFVGKGGKLGRSREKQTHRMKREDSPIGPRVARFAGQLPVPGGHRAVLGQKKG